MEMRSRNLAHGEIDHIVVVKMYYREYNNWKNRSSIKVSRAVIIPKHENKPYVAKAQCHQPHSISS